MRISTSQLFDSGVRQVNNQAIDMLRIQQQISTGRRIVNPSDDPVAAARVMELTQASDVIAQFSRNRDNAQSTLQLQESNLSSVGDLVTRVRELAVQLGNGSLTRENRTQITHELRARYDELLGYANARDGNGKYVFSGYMGDTRPFAGSVETGVDYFGDDGQRLLQVSPSRVIEVSDSGRSIFQRIRNGNGSFVTGVGIPAAPDPNDPSVQLPAILNRGTGVVDGGAVTDPAKWAASPYQNLRVQFSVDMSQNPPVTYYDIVQPDPNDPQNRNAGLSLLTGNALDGTTPTPFNEQRVYKAGQAIDLTKLTDDPLNPGQVSLGANIIVDGDPILRDPISGRPLDATTGLPVSDPVPADFTGTGDVFTIQPASTQDIFDTIRNLILDSEKPTGTSTTQALLTNNLGFALTNLDQVEQNLLKVRSLIGSRLNEVDSLQNLNEDLQIQYQQTISGLQDLDYAKAISDFTRKQTDLQAAQQTFSKISQLSLFNYL